MEWAHFCSGCAAYADRWAQRVQRAGGGELWQWRQSSRLVGAGSGFLQLVLHRSGEQLFGAAADGGGEDNDDAAAAAHMTYRIDLHVVYSCAYGVPVLYFNVCRADDGARVRLDDVWQLKRLAAHSQAALWELVTDGEHPILQTPFFFVHPCATAIFMRSVTGARSTDNDDNAAAAVRYLVLWHSVFVQSLGILPPLSSDEMAHMLGAAAH